MRLIGSLCKARLHRVECNWCARTLAMPRGQSPVVPDSPPVPARQPTLPTPGLESVFAGPGLDGVMGFGCSASWLARGPLSLTADLRSLRLGASGTGRHGMDRPGHETDKGAVTAMTVMPTADFGPREGPGLTPRRLLPRHQPSRRLRQSRTAPPPIRVWPSRYGCCTAAMAGTGRRYQLHGVPSGLRRLY